MRQIGFKNFRKFINFPKMDLAPITIFVGENNAGKSTVVKGILALADFLNRRQFVEWEDVLDTRESPEQMEKNIAKNIKNQRFYFNTSYLAHIGTFKRALCNKATDTTITFNTRIGILDIEIVVQGNRDDEDTVFGIIQSIKLTNTRYNQVFTFDLQKDEAEMEFLTMDPALILKKNTEPRLMKELETYYSNVTKPHSMKFKISSAFEFYPDLIESLYSTATNAIYAAAIEPENTDGRSYRGRRIGIDRRNRIVKDFSEEDIQFLKLLYSLNEGGYVERTPFYIRHMFIESGIEYIYAHAVSQTVIYSAKDTNDYLSRTIHEFASNKIANNQREFICMWMKTFSIGQDFEIKSIGGEAHIVYILNNDGEKVNLADKGMGSIQLMVLLFRLAINLPRQKNSRSFRRGRGSILIIEEPEQNLHPMLQSKLADLFYSLNQEYGFRFIIETHSEYLIRRSQVIVSQEYNEEEKLKWNPFKVYYFPSEGAPYDMVYATTGMFENKFGDGFINEAGKLHMEVLKNTRK
jgi:predicted ATP-dependent endonuclease of OLD family